MRHHANAPPPTIIASAQQRPMSLRRCKDICASIVVRPARPRVIECAAMAELPAVNREILDVDVVIVGAGPAGLAAAYRLAELIKAHNESPAEQKLEGISIAVLEKGKEIGSHGISGAV